MRRLSITLFCSLIALVWSGAAIAVPISVVLTSTSGSSGGFGFSFLHTATSNCETISGVEFCKNGTTYAIVNGSTLTGTLDGLHLSGLSGTLDVVGGADIIVTDGDINFAASAPDTFGGFLETSSHETFHFLDHSFAGPANTLTSTALFLWGNNWDTGTAAGHTDPDWGIDLGFDITPVPEPTTLTLFGVALLGITLRQGRERF